jgi:hypothetical protein
MKNTYKIIRFFKDDVLPSRVIKEGLTLQEAREHCQDDETRGENFFDGYEQEQKHLKTKGRYTNMNILICAYCNTENEVEYLEDVIECCNCGEELSKENAGKVL